MRGKYWRGKYWLSAILAMLLLFSMARPGAAGADLHRGFLNPPGAAKPWVYWFWLNGNITREGITADLEAMKRAGIGGVLIMEVDQGTPAGPVAFMSDQWRGLFKFMVGEAQRLGLEVNMNNDAGWNGSGGPWVPLDKAMQVVVTSETSVSGPMRFEGVLPQPKTNDGYYRNIAVLALPTPATAYRIENVAQKAVAWRQAFKDGLDIKAGTTVPADCLISGDRVVDLTARMDTDARLTWDAPAGQWTVIRFGHTFTGAKSHPAPASGAGPECDKLSKEGVEAHFNGMMGKLIQDVGAAAGKTLVSTHVDSWEVGSQNWTPKMREEFRKRRGYDMLRFLPVMTGRPVDSVDASERFLWDLRQTVSELLAENYIGHLRKLAHAGGLRLSMESYTTPANDMEVANYVDEPICEFWWPDGGWVYWSVKAMASAAHGNNRPIVGAEAFTAGKLERWLAHPQSLKAVGDRAFCDGVNRMIVHRYAMQPWPDRRPGMMMGRWGLHYERTQTWWEQSTAWHEYLARCQYMLRQGLFVADVLNLQPEEPMTRCGPLALSGYDYDSYSPRLFLENVSVQDGKLTLPHGMQYRLLLLPEVKSMTLPMLRKIKDLVEAGAVALGNPPQTVPGLTDYPKADAELKKLADALWGTDETVKQRTVGKGRVLRGMKAEEALTHLGVAPDFTADRGLRWIHRTSDGMEIYFVASGADRLERAVCAFRQSGKCPEFWDPQTGRIAPARYYEEENGQTRVPIGFEPSGSVFVVFRPGPADPARRVVSVKHEGRAIVPAPAAAAPSAEPAGIAASPAIDLVRSEVWQPGDYVIETADGKSRRFEIGPMPQPLAIAGPWLVRFDPNWGAPASITMETLASWSRHAEAGVRYFSGMATYDKKIAVPREILGKQRRVYLDLGTVAVMARVKLNGKDLGVLWKPPYRVEITGAVQAGENSLAIGVVNLWPNRMIGDEQLPEDTARNPNGTVREWPRWLEEGKPSPAGRYTFSTWKLWTKGDSLQESGLLGPVQILTAENIPGEP
jgi:hypothetical protein